MHRADSQRRNCQCRVHRRARDKHTAVTDEQIGNVVRSTSRTRFLVGYRMHRSYGIRFVEQPDDEVLAKLEWRNLFILHALSLIIMLLSGLNQQAPVGSRP